MCVICMTLLACYILASKRRYFIKPYPQPTFLRRLCEKNNKKPFPIFYLKKVLFHGERPSPKLEPGTSCNFSIHGAVAVPVHVQYAFHSPFPFSPTHSEGTRAPPNPNNHPLERSNGAELE